jgi:hypothetical protein
MNFNVGDKALFAVATTTEGQQFVGEVVEVIAVGPWPEWPQTAGREYGCVYPGSSTALVFGWQLRKLDNPPEPDALTRIKDKTNELAQTS